MNRKRRKRRRHEIDGSDYDSDQLSDAAKRYSDQDPTDRLGNCVAAGEDVNGDGYGDYLISAYWRSTQAPRKHREETVPPAEERVLEGPLPQHALSQEPLR